MQHREALFLHTQKTAGTSIQEMARHYYGNSGVISHADYVELGLEGCRRFPFVSGHFGIAFARPLMGARYCFTFLRDPIERLISLYAFCVSRDSDSPPYLSAKTHGLEGFLKSAEDSEDFRQRLWNHQVWQLAHGWGAVLAGAPKATIGDFSSEELLTAAKANVDAFDLVGFVETFDRDATTIFNALGWINPQPIRTNVSDKRLKLQDLPASTRNQLLELTELDRELYDYAWRRRSHLDS